MTSLANDTALQEASKQFMETARHLPTLYELSAQWLELAAKIETAEDNDDVDPWSLEIELDNVEGDIRQKADNIVGLSKWYDALAAARRAEVARIEEGARVYENRAERLRRYVLNHMKALGMQRIDTSRYSITLRQNPPSVAIVEPMMVPQEFMRERIIREPDKTKIKDHHKATGEIVPGTDIVRTERVQIS